MHDLMSKGLEYMWDLICLPWLSFYLVLFLPCLRWCVGHARWRLEFVMWWDAMIDEWLRVFGMIDDMLIVRCMLVCVCVCEFRMTILNVPLMRLRHKTQHKEANLRVRQF